MAGDGRGPRRGDENPWRYPTAALVILVSLGCVVYVTVRTTEIPATVVLPLIAAAAYGLWTFKISGKDS